MHHPHASVSIAERLVPLVILPAILLGAAAMAVGGVSPMLWGQQIAVWVILALTASPLRRGARRIGAPVWSAMLLLLLAATLVSKAVGGARRWLDLGAFTVNAAMLVLPALLTVLCHIRRPHPALLIAGVVLCLQPDLSQLAAFTAGALPLLWRRRDERFGSAGSALVLLALMPMCSRIPTAIEPVSYCEGILSMLADISPALNTAGWTALAIIPAYFLFCSRRQNSWPLLSLAAYYAVSMLFILTGEYPAPFIGYGLSPIAGCWMAYILSDAFSFPLAAAE